MNRDKGVLRRSVFANKQLLAKTLIHEDMHVQDLATCPAYLEVHEAYNSSKIYYEERARKAEETEYVP